MDIPTGLSYKENHLSTKALTATEKFLTNIKSWNTELKRYTKHYGYTYNYKDGKVEKCEDIPDELLNLHGTDIKFNQVIINRYLKGEGISPHVDSDKFGDTICCISIGSKGTMIFTHPLLLPYHQEVDHNSMYIMEKDARRFWKHSYKNISKTPRYSITYRIV